MAFAKRDPKRLRPPTGLIGGVLGGAAALALFFFLKPEPAKPEPVAPLPTRGSASPAPPATISGADEKRQENVVNHGPKLRPITQPMRDDLVKTMQRYAPETYNILYVDHASESIAKSLYDALGAAGWNSPVMPGTSVGSGAPTGIVVESASRTPGIEGLLSWCNGHGLAARHETAPPDVGIKITVGLGE
jgi:hypothetical protein